MARFHYCATLSGAQVLFCPPTKGRRSEWARYPSRTVPFITLWGFVAFQGIRIFLVVSALDHPPEWCSALAPRALGVPRVWSSGGQVQVSDQRHHLAAAAFQGTLYEGWLLCGRAGAFLRSRPRRLVQVTVLGGIDIIANKFLSPPAGNSKVV